MDRRQSNIMDNISTSGDDIYMETSKHEIVIVGGGIAGLSLALALHRVGLRALVLESFDRLRVSGAAFTTWTNAWKALDALGVGDSLRHHHTRLSGIIATSTEAGEQTAEVSFSGEHEVRCVKRKVLLETLAKELPSNTIRFSSKVVSIQIISGFYKLLHLADGSTLNTKVLIGCDGVNSVVARFLGFKKPSFTRRLAIRGYVNFTDNHGLDSKFLQFMGNGKRYGILPCDATTIYWFFTWSPLLNKDGDELEIDESGIKLKEFVVRNLGKVEERIKGVIEKTKVEDIICSPLRVRPPWELIWRDISRDNICIAGDALHPMTADLGQGACSALEDSIILARHLASHEVSSSDMDMKKIESGLKEYAKERKWRGIDLIATGYVVGMVQQTSWKFVAFLRDKVFATFLAGLLLNKAAFDCGHLNNTNNHTDY